jgi:hypothetical protein
VCMVLSLATGGMPMRSVGLATGGMPESSISFVYRWDACERWFILATGVTHVCLCHLVTVG